MALVCITAISAVKRKREIASVDGMILPGGESTTIGKLLWDLGLMAPLKDRILNGMPVWGTCAGLILLAKHILGEKPYLDVMDITVRRNAYGRQIDSFKNDETIPRNVFQVNLADLFYLQGKENEANALVENALADYPRNLLINVLFYIILCFTI